MKSKILLLLFLGMLNAQAQVAKKNSPTKKPTSISKPIEEGIFANILTNKGTIVVQLEYKKTPVTVANFIALAEGKNTFVTNEKLKGKPFYDGLKFHRVIKDFMIQGGDPKGNGTGGPEYTFKDEFTDLKFDKGGILAMANSGPATNGSQFFITHKDTPWLDGKHTIFGHVTQGMAIVNAIAQDDLILKITITRKGTLAKAFDAPKVFSTYFAPFAEEQQKQALAELENRKKEAARIAQVKKEYLEKYGTTIAAKKAYFDTERTTATSTASGLKYKFLVKGTGAKPADKATVYIHYSGYLEDGSLFSSSYEDINKAFGQFNQNVADQKGYQPFPFQMGTVKGLIPGFQEGLNMMSFGDKILLFIPSNLGYGAKGSGNVIPPNANLIFEFELLEKLPTN